jgi:hypothetical protein
MAILSLDQGSSTPMPFKFFFCLAPLWRLGAEFGARVCQRICTCGEGPCRLAPTSTSLKTISILQAFHPSILPSPCPNSLMYL